MGIKGKTISKSPFAIADELKVKHGDTKAKAKGESSSLLSEPSAGKHIEPGPKTESDGDKEIAHVG